MNKGQINTNLGQISINPDVIAFYVGMQAVECFGIVGMAAVSVTDGKGHQYKNRGQQACFGFSYHSCIWSKYQCNNSESDRNYKI